MIMTVDDAPHLDGTLVAFGKVREGLTALKEIVSNMYTQKGLLVVTLCDFELIYYANICHNYTVLILKK